MTEHTPGPWKVNHDDRYAIVSDKLERIAVVNIGSAKNEKRVEMARANADLIAMAPTLLMLAKESAAYLGRVEKMTGRDTLLRHNLAETIENAEGRTP